MVSCTNPGSRAGILGLRLGKNDTDVWRYICNHRGIRYDNSSEVHPQPSPGFEYVVFNSNWELPGVTPADGSNSTYICIIPDAWRSPNNDGS